MELGKYLRGGAVQHHRCPTPALQTRYVCTHRIRNWSETYFGTFSSGYITFGKDDANERYPFFRLSHHRDRADRSRNRALRLDLGQRTTSARLGWLLLESAMACISQLTAISAKLRPLRLAGRFANFCDFGNCRWRKRKGIADAFINDLDAGANNLIRIIDEAGEDYLYPCRRFRKLTLPADLQRALRRAS